MGTVVKHKILQVVTDHILILDYVNVVISTDRSFPLP